MVFVGVVVVDPVRCTLEKTDCNAPLHIVYSNKDKELLNLNFIEYRYFPSINLIKSQFFLKVLCRGPFAVQRTPNAVQCMYTCRRVFCTQL